MKNLGILSTAALMMLFLAGCATTQSQGSANKSYDFSTIGKVAVVSVNGPLDSEAAKMQITDMFNMELLRRNYSPVERQQIRSVIKEQGFQSEDVTSATNAAKLGRILNVDAAVIVNIPEYKEDMSMTAKMVDVETASILWVGSGSASTGGSIAQMAGTLAGAAAGGLGTEAATDDGTKGTIGAVAGAAVGNVAGRALTPQKEEQAQKLIAKLTESLPAR